jgi:hypothetical protein
VWLVGWVADEGAVLLVVGADVGLYTGERATREANEEQVGGGPHQVRGGPLIVPPLLPAQIHSGIAPLPPTTFLCRLVFCQLPCGV